MIVHCNVSIPWWLVILRSFKYNFLFCISLENAVSLFTPFAFHFAFMSFILSFVFYCILSVCVNIMQWCGVFWEDVWQYVLRNFSCIFLLTSLPFLPWFHTMYPSICPSSWSSGFLSCIHLHMLFRFLIKKKKLTFRIWLILLNHNNSTYWFSDLHIILQIYGMSNIPLYINITLNITL